MREIDRVIEKAGKDPEILAVLLFGSRARGEDHAASDIDVCLVLGGGSADRDRARRKRREYLEFAGCDIRVFELLPLYVRQRVLKDGKILHVKDEDALYEVAFRTIRAFEDFRPYYRRYLEQVAFAGS
jgi:predicted nucleotidyltransferase